MSQQTRNKNKNKNKNRIVTIQLLLPANDGEPTTLSEAELYEGLCIALCENTTQFVYQPHNQQPRELDLIVQDIRITDFPDAVDNPRDLALDELSPTSTTTTK
jgi:hypothetical protein